MNISLKIGGKSKVDVYGKDVSLNYEKEKK